MNGGPEHEKAMEMDKRGLVPASPGAMPPPCLECGGQGKINWKDVNGDAKQKICPRCHGTRTEQRGIGRGYQTK